MTFLEYFASDVYRYFGSSNIISMVKSFCIIEGARYSFFYD
ncbi:hypothetical protein SAMN04489723_109146 [Algoriphagus aquimarinus]|uniref:Uncharacterized protein n=1 Tax=Algoriphagus aquimarinus TaxID=237018 RepID=A0A1I1AZ43_9BACT|nr:hypothetical protein SAMN04489723_109146 [Algoriphagus aquimarinus]